MDKQTNRQTNRQTENSKPEATLIPVDRRGERANYFSSLKENNSLYLIIYFLMKDNENDGHNHLIVQTLIASPGHVITL